MRNARHRIFKDFDNAFAFSVTFCFIDAVTPPIPDALQAAAAPPRSGCMQARRVPRRGSPAARWVRPLLSCHAL